MRMPGLIIILLIIALTGSGIHLTRHVLVKQPSSSSIEIAKSALSNKDNWAKGQYVNVVKRSLYDYNIITRKDIFKPLGAIVATPIRQANEQPMPKEEQRQAPPEPMYKLALTGVVNIDGKNIALVEDSNRNQAYYLTEGEKLKDYFVQSISDDKMILRKAQDTYTFEVGSSIYYNKDGLITSRTVQSHELFSERQGSEGKEQVSLENKTSIIERMRARRRSELGQ